MKTNRNQNTKVFVALSGGVDSAVSAALLKKQGYDVTGVYMKNWSGDDFGIQADCPWEVDQADAQAVCNHLGIPFRSFNFEKQYREKVVEYFFDEYAKGRTPNPDVMCNKEIKFQLFLDKALEEGVDLIATGHYARKIEDISGNSKIQNSKLQKRQIGDSPCLAADRNFEFQVSDDGEEVDSVGQSVYRLYSGNDDVKNQVYFLYTITQEQLSKTLFPIGEYPKSEVRKLAKKFGLPNKDKPDSQGICFIGEIDVLKFLQSSIPKKPGKIVDIDSGEEVGEHEGIYFYTIGQRKGLGIGGQEEPYFVVDKDGEKNILYVGHGHDHPKLYRREVKLENFHAIVGNDQFLKDYVLEITNEADSRQPIAISSLQGVIRYQQKPQPCRLVIASGASTSLSMTQCRVIFDEPQWAVASGQSLVLFDGDECLGGGVIQ